METDLGSAGGTTQGKTAPGKGTVAPCVVWQPTPRQGLLLSCPVFEVFFGGARGGGKTDAVLGEWVNHASLYGLHAVGLMIRRSMTQLSETIERSKVLYAPLGAVFREQSKEWRFPNGARLRFAYLERDADADNYMGHSYTRLYVEEIGTFPSDKPILKLMATLRSGSGVPVGIRATGNPGGPGHSWVKARYIDPAPGGGKIITDAETGLKRIFIPSRVRDNPYLGADYTQRLRSSGSAALVKAWVDGDWDAIEGAFFDCWSAANIVPPFTVPKEWGRIRGMDWGSASPSSVGWYAIVQDDYRIPDGRSLPRGALVRYREYYTSENPAANGAGLKLTAEEVAQGIIDREKGDPRMASAVLDTSAFKEEGGPSIAERINRRLLDAKLMPFHEADRTRGAGWDAVRARIIGSLDKDGKPTGAPMLYVFNTCVALIRTLPALPHDPSKAEDVDTDAEDHASDELRYVCMSRPWLVKIIRDNIGPREDAYRAQDSTSSGWDFYPESSTSSRYDGYSGWEQSSVKLL